MKDIVHKMLNECKDELMLIRSKDGVVYDPTLLTRLEALLQQSNKDKFHSTKETRSYRSILYSLYYDCHRPDIVVTFEPPYYGVLKRGCFNDVHEAIEYAQKQIDNCYEEGKNL